MVDIQFQIDSGFEMFDVCGYIFEFDRLFFHEELVIVEVEDEESEGVRNFVVLVISSEEVPEKEPVGVIPFAKILRDEATCVCYSSSFWVQKLELVNISEEGVVISGEVID